MIHSLSITALALKLHRLDQALCHAENEVDVNRIKQEMLMAIRQMDILNLSDHYDPAVCFRFIIPDWKGA